MVPLERWEAFPFLSCPISQLADVEKLPGRGDLERRRTGRPAEVAAAD
jgi:hypothetical protein